MSKVIAGYNKDGELISSEDEDKIFAKSQANSFFVKKGKVGADASHLLNPNSMWFNEGDEKAFDKRSGRKAFEFAKVTENCFNLYVKFLKTKNPAHLRNAEREIQ